MVHNYKSIHKAIKLVKFHIELGSSPIKLLSPNHKLRKLIKFPIFSDNVPEKLFLAIHNALRLSNVYNVSGK